MTDLPLVRRRLQAAADRLSDGEGSLQERLQDACNQFLEDIDLTAFPTALRQHYRTFQARC